jgi:hypothetical protein
MCIPSDESAVLLVVVQSGFVLRGIHGRLHQLQLLQCIFLPPLPSEYKLESPSASSLSLCMDTVNGNLEIWEQGYAYAATMYEIILNHRENDHVLNDEEQNAVKLRMLSALLLPFADYQLVIKKKVYSLPLVMMV